MKDSKRIMIPTVDNTEERMMICLVPTRSPCVELPAEFVAEYAVAEATASLPMNVG